VLVIISVLVLFAFPVLLPGVPIDKVMTDVGNLGTLGALFLVVIAFRNALERQRLETMRHANQELQDLRESLEQRVEERTQELELKNRELESFAYSISHDLKAPLRGIDGYSRLLQQDFGDHLNEEGVTFLGNIRTAAQRMNAMIDGLLTYSRMQRRILNMQQVDLPALVEGVLAEYQAQINQRQVELQVNIPCLTVFAEPEGLIQAVRNLVDNAFKFTRQTPQPRIEVGGFKGEHGCTLWVRDNGIGFDMDSHERIYDVFQRLHTADEYAGTGVGLALVRMAMQRMGGRVWAESAPGKGATFYLEFPKSSRSRP
jgi:signal transduction histidine kinase